MGGCGGGQICRSLRVSQLHPDLSPVDPVDLWGSLDESWPRSGSLAREDGELNSKVTFLSLFYPF